MSLDRAFGSQSVEREQVHEASVRGLRTLFTVSQHVTSSAGDPATFFGAVTRAVAHLTVARKAAFWALQPDSSVTIQRDAFGFAEELLLEMQDRPCGADAEGVTYDILFGDRHWRAERAEQDARASGELGLAEMGVRDGVVVPWRAGDHRLGLLGVYDSARPDGFTEIDVWVARVAGLAAGLVWQERRAARHAADLERRQVHQAREYSERMSELEKAKSNVLNLAAQELRTPLGVIRDYLSLLEERATRDPEEIGRLMPAIRGKLNDMATLIEDMVDTARLEEGRIQLNLERLDLRELVAEWVEAAKLRAGSKHWIISQQEPRPVIVLGDRLRLGNVVMNLLENAIKYSPEGGPVHCSVTTEKAAAVVRIIDRGIGIAEGDLPTLFTRFGRVVNRETSSIPGTGLGLYLSRELGLMHGGDLAVESHPGVGSAFSLVLPKLPSEVEGLDRGMLPGLDSASSGYDVTQFGLSDMIRCGAAFRQLAATSGSFEEAASAMVRHLYDKLQAGEDGQRSSALVRLFRALPLVRLHPEQQELARRALGKRTVDGSLLCLTLVATSGEQEEWNDVLTSKRHRVIPLPSGERWSPMITRLVRDLGLDPNRARDPELFLDLLEKTCNVFHVPEARGSTYVPDQDGFVRPFGIKSVLGFGGVLARHDLYVVIIFSKAPIPRGCATLFRAISHNAKLVLQRFAQPEPLEIDQQPELRVLRSDREESPN